MTRALVVLLAPVVLAQARALRRRTPELEDPPGARRGGAGAPRVLVVGDSTAVGMGVDTLEEALPARLAARLGARWSIAGRSGWTATEVLRGVGSDAAAPADVLVLLVGWNDAMRVRSGRAFARALEGLIVAARAERVVIVAPPEFGRYPVLPQPLRAALGAVANGLTRRAARIAEAHGAALVPGFDGSHVARDGFHPDASGYDAMAERIAAELSTRR
ncbi:SGNH/GDSL hydrolase family protein [Pseudolysinimonas kribbensis]|uniref:Lipase n=1 Tax=Pseudolysinimonas kribbensis TaxID=433641 RepID=A0ABQ6K4M2_9MICO|nr:SGNH/GDSL hydrolase family protein [Pseudolysinimonas kribbensis]GMA95294.1 lipase [Pseudolysinimonas kribbensis]